MRITKSFAETRSVVSGTVGLVPTMGFLHEGHLSLIEAARRSCDTVVMSLFVNPLQFDREDDLVRYPRNAERDVDLATAAGADVVFAPEVDEMYPNEQLTRVNVGQLSDELEGPNRPGHFEGVATVVAKLLAGIQPDRSFFGRKDAQQLAIVRRMSRDLSMPGEIVGVPIVREADGLALSSRNVFLSDDERQAALALSRGLLRAADLVAEGERVAGELAGVVHDEVGDSLEVEYVSLAGQDLVQPLKVLDRPAFLALAAWSGKTRLIDNVHFDGDTFIADRGIRLTERSVLYGTGEI
ncbi:MAG: pantoate--beta-alanine ligase [Acidimicrobiia bacterium]|nr:pantoate--beta-alanine ligase [Acidimicrobiia bacterium]MDX2467553.1 pantoate--beta-alanine ligase [Acidimicrobiia bacterium]